MNKVVIIDDHKLYAMTLSAILSKVDAVELVADYQDIKPALNNLKQDSADLYIVDAEIEDQSGLDFGIILKKQCPDIKLVLLTMNKYPELRKRAIMAGFDLVLYKDFEMEDFLRAIKGILV